MKQPSRVLPCRVPSSTVVRRDAMLKESGNFVSMMLVSYFGFIGYSPGGSLLLGKLSSMNRSKAGRLCLMRFRLDSEFVVTNGRLCADLG